MLAFTVLSVVVFLHAPVTSGYALLLSALVAWIQIVLWNFFLGVLALRHMRMDAKNARTSEDSDS